MSKTIPIALQSHLDQNATTTCRLLKIEAADGSVVGFSSTNKAIAYDDGDGEITYAIQSGFDHSALQSTNDASVDNAEARVVLIGNQVTEAAVLAGKFDNAKWTVYQVNYEDLSQGHRVVGHGYLGKPRIGKGGAWVSFELRSLVDKLRQVPWEKWSRRCRVRIFGSQVGEERFPCMYDASGEWVNDVVVTSVGTESDRTFTASALAQADDYFAPGMVEFTVGNNAGLSFEVEAFASGGTITLTFPTPYPIEDGDEFNIRRDCTREWSGHNSCETYGNRPNFRGEPKIKIADGVAASVPGASVSPGSGGQTYQPQTEEA